MEGSGRTARADVNQMDRRDDQVSEILALSASFEELARSVSDTIATMPSGVSDLEILNGVKRTAETGACLARQLLHHGP